MRILLLDDSPLVREATARLLARTFEGASVEAGAGLSAATSPPPTADLVVVNISPLDSGDLGDLTPLAAAAAPAPVAVLDSRARPARAAAARSAGCRGYITLTAAGELIAAALGVVAAGGEYHPPEAPGRDGAAAAGGRLSARQRDVARRLAEGKTNREIAGDLGIAVPTVKLHVHAILSAIGARNRTEAALWARSAAAQEA